MGVQVLVADDKCEGKYVALRSFADNTVLAVGETPEGVLQKAAEAGAREPVLVFVHDPGIGCIY
jgi:hypothetical protein